MSRDDAETVLRPFRNVMRLVPVSPRVRMAGLLAKLQEASTSVHVEAICALDDDDYGRDCRAKALRHLATVEAIARELRAELSPGPDAA